MDRDDKPKRSTPNVSQVDFEDRFKVLMDIAPEGEEITVYKESGKEEKDTVVRGES